MKTYSAISRSFFSPTEKTLFAKRLSSFAAFVTTGVLCAHAATITWDFNDGTLQGWTQKSVSSAGAGYYDLAFAPMTSTHGWVAADAGLGSYFLGESPESNDSISMQWANWPAANSGVHQTLWIESPAFTLDGSGDLTFRGLGCPGAPNPAKRPDWICDIPLTTIPAVAGNWGPDSGNPTGNEGTCALGLRRDDGTFVLTCHVDGWGGSFDTYRFTAAQLAPFVNDGHYYTLDLVDSLAGTGAWIAIDDVNVPGKPAQLIFNFDDGTMQGWKNKSVSTAAAGYCDLAFGPVTAEGPWDTTQHNPPACGAYFLGQSPLNNDGLRAQWTNWPAPGSGIHQTLWVHSPAFTLNGSGDLTFQGYGSDGAINPATDNRDLSLTNTPIPAMAGTWGAESGNPANTAGTCAVGLRRDDGTFVLSRNFHGFGGGWDTYTFTAAELAPYVNDGHTYTLDMVDFLGGTYAWCAIDNVIIPGTRSDLTGVPMLRVTYNADKTKLILTCDKTADNQPLTTILISDDLNKPVANWTQVTLTPTQSGSTTAEIPAPSTKIYFRTVPNPVM